MTEPAAPAPQSLEVRQLVGAAPEDVFDAWIDPDVIPRWFAPTDDFTVVPHHVDPRAGGRYRIEMRHKDGGTHVAVGEYRELDRPARLVFTWRWETEEMPDTLVEIEFRPADDGTEVVLVHTRFDTAARRDSHLQGWTGCLGRLAGAFADA